MSSVESRMSVIKRWLNSKDRRSFELVAYDMKYWPEVHMVDLDDLAWTLDRCEGAHKNDAVGLVEVFEKRWADYQDGKITWRD